MIADDSGAIGFGGIIGGESTGVDEGTTDVLLECAWFDPARIGATGQPHGIDHRRPRPLRARHRPDEAVDARSRARRR